MIEPIPAEEAEQATAHENKQAIAHDPARKRDILARLRRIGDDVRAIEQRVIEDYDSADQERAK